MFSKIKMNKTLSTFFKKKKIEEPKEKLYTAVFR